MEFKEVKVIINGKEIEVNQFVSAVFGNTINGMVSSLRLEDSPREIEIKITVK